MVVILIKRCVREGRDKEFLDAYKHPHDAGFIGEILTKVSSIEVPLALRNLPIACEKGTTYLNIAFWKSVEAFHDCFKDVIDKPLPPDAPEYDRKRIVLDVEQSSQMFSEFLSRFD